MKNKSIGHTRAGRSYKAPRGVTSTSKTKPKRRKAITNVYYLFRDDRGDTIYRSEIMPLWDSKQGLWLASEYKWEAGSRKFKRDHDWTIKSGECWQIAETWS